MWSSSVSAGTITGRRRAVRAMAAPAGIGAYHPLGEGTVELVHQQPGVLPLCGLVQRGKRRAVAVHAENAFSDRQLFARQRLSQQLRELLRQAVGVALVRQRLRRRYQRLGGAR